VLVVELVSAMKIRPPPGMSARLAVDSYGRLIAEGTLLDIRGLRWSVLDWREMFEPQGRAPSPREMATTRAPFNAPRPVSTPIEVPDDQLNDREAIRLAILEQCRQPPDLVNVAA
jgi:hypothetical protein